VRAARTSIHHSSSRFSTRSEGIVSRHSFSFGAHYDPDNVAYGPLLVSNEDVVEVGAGYGTHPHRDAEILTWVLAGTLVHEDSAGNLGAVHPGLAQRMSAGSGIRHAEWNDPYRIEPGRHAEPVHFVQMWLRPDVSGTVPGYASREIDLRDAALDWVPVASGSHPDAAISLGTQAATLWLSRLAPAQARLLPDAERLHLQVARGAVDLEGAGRLDAGDSARILDAGGQRVTGIAAAELLVWTLPR